MTARTGLGGWPKSASCGFAAVALAGLLMVGTSAWGAIQFRSGPYQPVAQTPQQIEAAVAAAAAGQEGRHVVVQFGGPIDGAQRKQLAGAGLRLLRYLPDDAYFAVLSDHGIDAAAIGATPGIRAIEPVRREWKLDPRILAGDPPAWAVVSKGDAGLPGDVAVYALFHPDVPLARAVEVAQAFGANVRDRLESINGLVLELPRAAVEPLADDDAVQWIEWPLPRMSPVNDSNRAITQANVVQAAPYGLSGAGVNVLVYDANQARSTHADFQGRMTLGSGDASGMADHATHVSCTIGGAGVANATYKGMAPGVSLVSYGFEYDGTGIFLYSNPGDIETDFSRAINSYGAVIDNSSIGTNTETNGFDCAIQGDYGVTSELIDTIVRGDGSNPLFASPFRVVWANGNERQGSRCDVEGYGDYYSTAPPAGSKNHIAVGALNSNDDSMTSFSSWGPVDDGRMKPDISAPGCQSDGDYGVTSCSSASDTSYTTMCGTSMAAPTVTGLSSLLLQDFRAQFPGEPDFRNSTLKVLLAHNALDLGNPGPDYQYGYGSVRIQKTVDFLRTRSFLENQVGQAGTYSVLVVVNPGDPELKVTLAWDDYPATLNTGVALINDLDLRVFDPSSQQHYPWTLNPTNPSAAAVRTQANHIDNIEQVYVQNPVAGVWRVEVYGFNVPEAPQPFSLAASPAMVACSSAGTIALNASKYLCSATAAVQVIDCDLNANNNVVETVTVNVKSTSEPAGEPILLTETGAQTADFRGTLPLSTVNGSGVLWVTNGDTVTATYVDADNGQGGHNVTVTDTALVDCAAPVISAVQTTNVGPFGATVTFNTDEPANGTVRYGLSCASLGGSSGEFGLRTAHSVALSGLQKNTAYYYVVDAVDEAGNAATDNNGGACYTFTTTDLPDYFTELYVTDNDLDNLSLTFEPDGSFDYYDGCAKSITALPVDPSGGTTLTLTDDSYATVNLSGGGRVSLYGTSYGSFYVSSNGYVTFTQADSSYNESTTAHFSLARISALFDDLNPGAGGTVSWKQLTDRAVVTWQNVPQYGTTDSNTMQIEMRFDGTIVVSFLAVAATDGLAGLSRGNGLPADFVESDLSAMPGCIECLTDPECGGGGRLCCDGACLTPACSSGSGCSDGDVCTSDVCSDPGTCTAICSNPPLGCGPTDGCCPAGCAYPADSDCCRPSRAACTQNNQCCSNRCKGGKNKFCL